MRAPPPVALVVEPDPAWAAVQILLAALSGAVGVGWVLRRTGLEDGGLWLLSGVAGLALGLAYARAARNGPGMLRWTGQRWQWIDGCTTTSPSTATSAPPPAPEPLDLDDAPRVMVDLGGRLWLRLRSGTAFRTRWVVVRRTGDAAQWAAFRAALYSPASRTSGQSLTDQPPS